MKLSDKIAIGVVWTVILSIGLVDLYLKYDRWNTCRSIHGFIYCMVLG